MWCCPCDVRNGKTHKLSLALLGISLGRKYVNKIITSVIIIMKQTWRKTKSCLGGNGVGEKKIFWGGQHELAESKAWKEREFRLFREVKLIIASGIQNILAIKA